MFINFGSFDSAFEAYDVTFEIYIDGKLTSSQTMEAPRMMIESQFVNLLEQIRRDSRHIKVRMTRPIEIWDSFEKRNKILQNYIEVENR